MFGRKCSCFVRFEDCILFVGPLFEVVYCAVVCDSMTVASRLEGTDRAFCLGGESFLNVLLGRGCP